MLPWYFSNFNFDIYYAGADVVIFERLKAGQDELKTQTQDHLDVRICLIIVILGHVPPTSFERSTL